MIFGNPKRPKASEKVLKRVHKIPAPELPLWADQSLLALSQNFRAWQNSDEPALLEEAILAAEASLALLLEVKRRSMYSV